MPGLTGPAARTPDEDRGSSEAPSRRAQGCDATRRTATRWQTPLSTDTSVALTARVSSSSALRAAAAGRGAGRRRRRGGVGAAFLLNSPKPAHVFAASLAQPGFGPLKGLRQQTSRLQPVGEGAFG